MTKKPKKKLTVLALALLLPLTACNNSLNNPAETSQNETSVSTSSNILTSAPTDTEQASLSPQEQLEAAMYSFPTDVFTTPDGKEHSINEAVSGVYDESTHSIFLTFDFGYMGYAPPFYYDTNSNPELFFGNFEFNQYDDKINDEIKKGVPEVFKVKKGQTLENGLTVSDAELTIHPINRPNEKGAEITSINVKTEGDLTLSGVLFHISQDPQYLTSLDDVMFYPDTSKESYIPYPYWKTSDNRMPIFSGIDVKNEFAFATSSIPYRFGNLNEMDIDVSDYFTQGDYVKVNVTITDPYVRYTQGNPFCGGELTKIEAAE